MTSPGTGWRARLDLTLERAGEHTRLTRRRHEGPLLVQRAFHPEPGACHLYVIHPPGGVVSGDELMLAARVGPDAHALLTTPAAGKFYRCGAGGPARLTQRFEVDGTLEWLPQENILYPQAAVQLQTTVRLARAARFIGMEVTCLGLPAQRAPFGDGSLRQGFELWREETPLLLERMQSVPGGLQSRWGLAGNAAFGTLLATPATPALLECARTAAAAAAAPVPDGGGEPATPEVALGLTLVDAVLVCRGLAPRADRLRGAFQALWRALRPQLLGRAAVPPRIWAT